MESFPSQQLSLHKHWDVYETGENDQVLMRKTVSTDELLADEFILDIKGRQQQTLDPREAKRQQSAQNRRRKQDEMRRTTFAVDMARTRGHGSKRISAISTCHAT
jgi:hypothetical protein